MKMSSFQPCQLIFVTSIYCFFEYLCPPPHKGPSAQGTSTQNSSHQAFAMSLSASSHLLHVPGICGPFLHVGFPHPALRAQNSGSHTPQPQRQKETLSSLHQGPLPFSHPGKQQWKQPFSSENFPFHHRAGLPKASTGLSQRHLLSPHWWHVTYWQSWPRGPATHRPLLTVCPPHGAKPRSGLCTPLPAGLESWYPVGKPVLEPADISWEQILLRNNPV